jgi:hypothetical protein
VPYELHHETWALERAARLYGLKKKAVARVENYTACFPTGMDGQVYAKQLRRCRGRYPRLYVLNGLAGEGITRGPGAGLHLAQLIGKALNKTEGPRDIPQRNLVWVLEDLGYEFTVGTLIFLSRSPRSPPSSSASTGGARDRADCATDRAAARPERSSASSCAIPRAPSR